MAGLNDDFLLADDSMEPKQEPAAVVHAFKEENTEPGEVPELRDDIDLIAVAVEDLQVKLRDLELLQGTIAEHGGMSQTIALEAQALMPEFINEDRPIGFFTKQPSKTMLQAALEEIESEKKSALGKAWDVIINFLKRLYQAVVKFLTGLDLAAEEAAAKKAAAIAKNKQEINFVNDVVRQMSPLQLAIISAIEEEEDFMSKYLENVELDRKIDIPLNGVQPQELRKYAPLRTEMERNLTQLNIALTQADEQDADEKGNALRKALVGGYSINGSEHGEYLKAFASKENEQQKYGALLKMAESYKKDGAGEDMVSEMRALATTLFKQFSMESKVVGTFSKLSKAIISVNEKIYAGAE